MNKYGKQWKDEAKKVSEKYDKPKYNEDTFS